MKFGLILADYLRARVCVRVCLPASFSDKYRTHDLQYFSSSRDTHTALSAVTFIQIIFLYYVKYLPTVVLHSRSIPFRGQYSHADCTLSPKYSLCAYLHAESI